MHNFYRKTFLIISCYFLFEGFLYAEEVHIDHVIVAVSNIDDASSFYKNIGFTIKPGRMHKNGLLNAHIKMSNNTAIELMSLVGPAKDKIAQEYYEILKNGEVGAYLSLSGMLPGEFSTLVGNIPFEHEVIDGYLWDYVIFPEGSGLEHIFLFYPHREFGDEDWVYTHRNGAAKINQVWLEGGRKVEKLLKVLGARYCGKVTNNFNSSGKSYHTSTGNIVVVEGDEGRRPRILGVSIEMRKEKDPVLIGPNHAHGIWVDNSSEIECEVKTHNKANPADAKKQRG